MKSGSDRRCIFYLLIGGLGLLMYLIRLSGPTDLEGYAQNRNIGYVMDAVGQNNWLVQQDIQNRITSKPPLHTWVAAALSSVFGINRITLTLPSFAAILCMALLAFEAGRRIFGLHAGVAAGVALLLNLSVAKHIALVRSDALFALAVMLAALAAWHAWTKTSNWLPFWLAAAAATLIKGPLGVVLGAAGLLAFFIERRGDPSVPRPGGSHRTGIALYLLLCFGWFAAAFLQSGGDLYERMIVQELFGHSAGVRRDSFPLSNLPKPSLFFMARFLPFSIPAVAGLWRVVRHPEKDPVKRRFERFLFCWFITGLVLFSLATHHRADLLLPLWPAGALLAGREIIRFRDECRRPRLVNGAFVLLSMSVLLLCIWNYHALPERRSKSVFRSVSVRQAAEALGKSGIPLDEVVHLNTPVTLQMVLGTHKKWTAPDQIRERLDQGESLLIAVYEPESLPLFEETVRGCSVQTVFSWPQETGQTVQLAVFRVTKTGF